MAKRPINIDGEIWRDVPGYDGIQASNLGRVRRILVYSPVKNWFGYNTVSIRRAEDERSKLVKAHRLVCLAFHGEPSSSGLYVAHKNGVPDDNRQENLMWATPKENAAHKLEHGTAQIGTANGNAVIGEADVARIRAAPLTKAAKEEIAQELGITRGHVNDIIKRRCWRHLP